LTGAINYDSVLKALTSGDNRERLANSKKRSSPQALSVSIALKSDPAQDEKGQAWVDVRKWYRRSWKKNIDMAAPVLFKLFSAKTNNSSPFFGPATWPTAEFSKK
jgi:hypothetical protein